MSDLSDRSGIDGWITEEGVDEVCEDGDCVFQDGASSYPLYSLHDYIVIVLLA